MSDKLTDEDLERWWDVFRAALTGLLASCAHPQSPGSYYFSGETLTADAAGYADAALAQYQARKGEG